MFHKKILFLMLFILSFPFASYGGHGPIAEEQPYLVNEMNNWERGSPIPQYLLMPDGNYNPLSMYTPGSYIYQTTNADLLFSLMLHPDCPEENSAFAFSKIIELKGLGGFDKHLKTITQNNTPNIDKKRIDKLQKIFFDKCIIVY